MFVLLISDLCTLHLCILLLAQWCHGRQRPCNFLAMPSLSEVGELMSEAAELQIGVCGTNLLLLVLPVLPCKAMPSPNEATRPRSLQRSA